MCNLEGVDGIPKLAVGSCFLLTAREELRAVSHPACRTSKNLNLSSLCFQSDCFLVLSRMCDLANRSVFFFFFF